MYFYFGVQWMYYIKNQLLIEPKAIAYNNIFHVYGKKSTCSHFRERGMTVRLPFAKLLVLSATVAYSCSSGHFISLTWLHALVRRGLRIRFNWDYISIKTSSPLEREKAASNFRGDKRGGAGKSWWKEERGETNNWYGQRALSERGGSRRG